MKCLVIVNVFYLFGVKIVKYSTQDNKEEPKIQIFRRDNNKPKYEISLNHASMCKNVGKQN